MATSKGRPVRQPTAYERVRDAFLNWNLDRKGTNELHVGDSYWFRGDIMFYENSPSWRAVKGPRGMLIVLCRFIGYHTPKDSQFNSRVKAFTVPDLAVFSRFPGDLLEDYAEMHERIRWIMFSEVREFTGGTLCRMSNKDVATKPLKVQNHRDEMVRLYQRYNNYSDLFGLKWEALPQLYVDGFDAERRQKENEWNDPRAKMARDRAHARKQAVKALDLDNDQ